MIQAAFLWLGRTPIGLGMRTSTWGFATVETIHLLDLAVLGGAVLVTNFAAARALFRRNDPVTVARAALPVLVVSLAVMVGSGVLLVASKPLRYYLDDIFRIKIALLALAVLSSILVQWLLGRPAARPILVRGGAAASLLLWLGVGVCGRLIGFL